VTAGDDTAPDRAGHGEGRTRLSAVERRSQLVGIGRSVFAEKGYDATSVEEIAERAGISKPVVYEHFGGKEGLYAVIVDREMEFVIEQISAAISTGTPRDRLEGAALAFMRYVEERPDGFRFLSRDSPTKSGLANLLAEVAQRVGDVMTSELRRTGYDADLAPLYAQALIGMVTFVGQWWMGERAVAAEEAAAHTAALAWMGLRHLPERAQVWTPEP
jgi:AcrR family transcriptional regulator